MERKYIKNIKNIKNLEEDNCKERGVRDWRSFLLSLLDL